MPVVREHTVVLVMVVVCVRGVGEVRGGDAPLEQDEGEEVAGADELEEDGTQGDLGEEEGEETGHGEETHQEDGAEREDLPQHSPTRTEDCVPK